jgi:putative peptidoglycan lipid II flippase
MMVLLIPVAPQLGVEPIVVVAAATIIGGIAQIAIQWRPLRQEGYGYRPALDLRDPALGRVLMLMGPGTIGLAATQINIFVNTRFATDQGTGAVAALDYAFRVMYLPIGLFGVSIAAASTPALSRLVAANNRAEVRSTVASAIGLMLALNVPATLGLMALATPIIALIFEHGRFTADDTAATARALQFYAVGLVGYSIVRIVSPAFYALRRSRIPVIASVVSVIANISMAFVLVRVMGFAGLALATSLAAIANAATQLFFLRRELGGIQAGRILITFVKTIAAAAPMAAAAWFVESWLRDVIGGTGVARDALRVLGSIVVALAVLSVAAWAVRLHEFEDARHIVLGRLRRLRR